MAIKSIKTLQNALKRVTKGQVEATLIDAMSFARDQLCEHRNTTPLAVIYGVIPEIAGKPKGFNRANMADFIGNIGLELDKKEGTISVPKGLNLNPTSIKAAFWIDYQEETVQKTPAEKFQVAVKSADKAGLSFEDMIEILSTITENDVELEKKVA